MDGLLCFFATYVRTFPRLHLLRLWTPTILIILKLFFVWGASPGSAGCFKKATQTPSAGHPISRVIYCFEILTKYRSSSSQVKKFAA
jgi:hypothetical protein